MRDSVGVGTRLKIRKTDSADFSSGEVKAMAYKKAQAVQARDKDGKPTGKWLALVRGKVVGNKSGYDSVEAALTNSELQKKPRGKKNA